MPTVLITGASSGLGRDFADIFAEKGYHLVLVARRRNLLESIQTKYKNLDIKIYEKDLSVPGSAHELFDMITSEGISIDILINNAGFGDFGPFEAGKLERYTQMIHLNTVSLTELSYLFGKEMLQKKSGKILNIASTAAFQPGPLMSVYFATKHYVLAFSEAIAEEWYSKGVIVTTLCPGPTATEFQEQAHASENKMFTKKLPTSREVAEYGYASLMNEKRVAIHGFLNRFLAFIVRFTPRILIVKIIKNMQQ